jgi:hypothetical protein
MLTKMNNQIIPTMDVAHEQALMMAIIIVMITTLAIGLYNETLTSAQIDNIVEKIREIKEKIEAEREESEEEDEEEEEEEDEYEVEQFEPATFEFANGLYAHYFEDPDSHFVLVLPEETIRGESIIEASLGHVTRSNPKGNPIISYIDSDGGHETYVLPDYSGNRFCEFINSKL